MMLAPITAADFDHLKPFFAGQSNPLCVYSLGAILCWRNPFYYPCATIRDETLVIAAEFVQRPEQRHLILPLRPGAVPEAALLRELALETGYRSYWYVPETYLAAVSKSELLSFFEITEQPDLSDYLYRREDLAELRGNRFSKKRNLIRQFEREYAVTGRLAVEPIGVAQKAECVAFLERWCAERDCDANPQEDLACEKVAVLNALSDLERLEMRGLLMRIDGQVSAFGIASDLTGDMGVLHFEKAQAEIKGLYQALDRECACGLFGAGQTLINKESDMGLPGLAKAKHSYHPLRLERSYRLDLR